MFFLNDFSTFARRIGSKDKKPRLRKLRKALLNADTLGSAATGSALGYAVGRGSDILRKSNNSYGEAAGMLGGLGVGAAITGYNKYKQLSKKNRN